MTLTSKPNLPPWLLAQWQQWQQLQNRLGHAYLFSGPKGIAIERFTELVAQTIFCESRSACGHCSGCHLFATRQHPDFYHLSVLEDKKEISVEQVRGLISQLNEMAHQGGYKVAWVECPEHLNKAAFNAILKSLEEPAKQTLFLLTTHQAVFLPATIISRCQKLNFTMPSLDSAQAWLQHALPQADQALLTRALRLNWGAPIDAKNWIEASKFEQDSEWKTTVKQIQAGQKSVRQVVDVWLKWPQPEQVFDFFYLWTVSALRAGFYKQSTPYTAVQKQNWLRFQQACLKAKQNWQRNANKQLVLEALCLEWLQIQQLQAPLESVFADENTKGKLA